MHSVSPSMSSPCGSQVNSSQSPQNSPAVPHRSPLTMSSLSLWSQVASSLDAHSGGGDVDVYASFTLAYSRSRLVCLPLHKSLVFRSFPPL